MAVSRFTPPQKSLDDRVPPHSVEAEMCALGTMILSERGAEEVQAILSEEDFYRPSHREIFKAIRQLMLQSKAIDWLTLEHELKVRQKLEEVGGMEYLIQIADAVPSAHNAAYYAQIVQDLATLRRLEEAGREIIGLVHDPDREPDEKVDEAEDMVFEVGRKRLGKYFSPVRSLAKDFFKDVDHLLETGEPILGVPSGFTDLDTLTTGFYGGDFVIIAARPAMGKTSLVMNMAVNVARQGKGNVAVFNLEMSGQQLVRRMISTLAEVPMGTLKKANLSPTVYQKLTDACERLYELPIFIDDSSDVSPIEMRGKCRRLKANGGLALVIVDYLQLMRGSRRTENRTQEISDIARALKALAKDLDVPVIALSQLNRGVESRPDKRPLLSDIRESGSIEAEADMVMFIFRKLYYERREAPSDSSFNPDVPEPAELIIGKHRNGPTGTVLLGFKPAFTQFVLLDEQSKSEYFRALRAKGTDE
ncbi:MAG: replicative DNA helicase [Armatimonadetes bacterium]|nr:replicative DNA helicase [Armatimonadota bacterium]